MDLQPRHPIRNGTFLARASGRKARSINRTHAVLKLILSANKLMTPAATALMSRSEYTWLGLWKIAKIQQTFPPWRIISGNSSTCLLPVCVSIWPRNTISTLSNAPRNHLVSRSLKKGIKGSLKLRNVEQRVVDFDKLAIASYCLRRNNSYRIK